MEQAGTGFSLQTLLPVFKEASNRLTGLDRSQILQPRRTQLENDDDATNAAKPFIFHLRHHPHGVTRQQVRAAYKKFIEPIVPERPLIIAVLRPKNIKDRVCRTRLPDIAGNNPSNYIQTGDHTMSPQILP
jgi:hypothetical protein